MYKKWKNFNKTAKLYLISQFLLAGYYTWPFWYGFAVSRITPQQFGIYIAVAYTVGLVAEVPTGAFADRFGRKRSAIIGTLFMSSYGLIVYFGGNFGAYILAAIISGIGGAFLSGSTESLVYESDGVDKETYREIMKLETIFWQAGLILATGLGGFLFSLHQSIPFFIQTVSIITASLFILQIKESRSIGNISDKEIEVTKNSVLHAGYLFYVQNTKGFQHLFSVRRLTPLLLFGTLSSTLLWVGVENLNEASMIHHGFAPEFRGLVIASTKLVVAVSLLSIIYKLLKSDRHKLLYIFILFSLAHFLYTFDNGILFLVGFLIFNLVSSVIDNFIRPILHDHLDNKYRATAISSYSFIVNLSVAAFSIVVGRLLAVSGVVVVHRLFFAIYLTVGFVALKYSIKSISPKAR